MPDFNYTPEALGILEGCISPARLSTYLRMVQNGSLAEAVHLYGLNARLSGAFLLPAQSVEITLRNKCAAQFARRYGQAWVISSDIPFMTWQQDFVIEKWLEFGRMPSLDALHFGFWTPFFTRGREDFWRSDTHAVFVHRPPGLTRKRVFAALDRIRLFRNRIAHHEQIIGYDPMGHYQDMLDLIGWLDQGQVDWVEHYSSVAAVWREIQEEKSRRGWTGF